MRNKVVLKTMVASSSRFLKLWFKPRNERESPFSMIRCCLIEEYGRYILEKESRARLRATSFPSVDYAELLATNNPIEMLPLQTDPYSFILPHPYHWSISAWVTRLSLTLLQSKARERRIATGFGTSLRQIAAK